MLVTRFPGYVGDESDYRGWRQQCWLGLSLDLSDSLAVWGMRMTAVAGDSSVGWDQLLYLHSGCLG